MLCCRKLLERKLKERGPRFLLHSYPDVLYGHYGRPAQESCGDVFYFDYGCVAFWGLTQKQEQDILRNLVVPCEDNPLPPAEVEIDEFQARHCLVLKSGRITPCQQRQGILTSWETRQRWPPMFCCAL